MNTPRIVRTGLQLLVLTAFVFVVSGTAKPAAAQTVTPEEQREPVQLTGSWLTNYQVSGFTTTVPVLLTFHDDRTVFESDSPTPNPLFNRPAALSNGQGAWLLGRGLREYTFYYRKLIFDETGSTPSGSTATLGNVTISPDGRTLRASIEIIFYDASNKITNQTSGIVTGTRIVVPEE